MLDLKSKVKLGTTVRPETKLALKRHAALDGLDGPGPAIDALAGAVSGVSAHAAARLDKLLAAHIDGRRAAMESTQKPDERMETREEIAWLQRLQRVLRPYGTRVDLDEEDMEWRCLDLYDGDYAVIPAQWDVFERDSAANSHYVYHAFMRNADKVGIPDAVITTCMREEEHILLEFLLASLRERHPDAMKLAEANMVPEVLDPETGKLMHWEEIKASNNLYVVEIGDYRLSGALWNTLHGDRRISVVRTANEKE